MKDLEDRLAEIAKLEQKKIGEKDDFVQAHAAERHYERRQHNQTLTINERQMVAPKSTHGSTSTKPGAIAHE